MSVLKLVSTFHFPESGQIGQLVMFLLRLHLLSEDVCNRWQHILLFYVKVPAGCEGEEPSTLKFPN